MAEKAQSQDEKSTNPKKTAVKKTRNLKPKPLKSTGRAVYIIDGARTPFIKARNKAGPFTPVDLAVQAGRPLLARQPFEPSEFDEVILGSVMIHPDEVNPGRVAALRLGCGVEVPGWTVQRNCASGQQSLDVAWRYISQGHGDLILAGGAEALSHSPLLFSEQAAAWFGKLSAAKSMGDKFNALRAFRPQFLKPSIGLLRGLTDPVVKLNMGQTVEILAHQFGVSRKEADAYAVSSHQRLAKAHKNGHLEELEPMIAPNGTLYDYDDGVREATTLEDMGKLRPVFERPFGKVTAGNSSQITDGASWVILASEDAVKHYGLNPMARIIDCAWEGLDPSIMGLGPTLASNKLLKRHNLKREDIGGWELNEAFAAQVLSCLNAFNNEKFCQNILGREEAFGEISHDILNIDGGGVSLGHPVGTSGNRITLHLVHALRRLGGRIGIATECIGGGLGGAMLVELMDGGASA